MSLISIKNFISPFTNTVHLVTIILITVLFALFRLQGGGVGVSSPKYRETRTQSEAPSLDNLIQEDTVAAPVPARKVVESETITISEDEEDLIKQMIGKKPLEAEQAKPADNGRKSGNGGGLDEIEKTLGMR